MPKKNQFSNANRQKLISYSCSTPRKTRNSVLYRMPGRTSPNVVHLCARVFCKPRLLMYVMVP